MTDTVVIVIAVACVGILLGGLTAYNSYRREVRDHSRQDVVAEKVALVATLTAQAKASTDAQLERIHTLVNSNLTAQMEDALASKKAQYVALVEVKELKEVSGLQITAEARSVMKETEETIRRKEVELADRMAATSLADMEAKGET